MSKTIRAGSEALLVYPEGDVDRVRVLSLQPGDVTVRVIGSGRVLRVVEESIGIGVDERLVAEYDAGFCLHRQRRGHGLQDLFCRRLIHGPDVRHLHDSHPHGATYTRATGWTYGS